MSEPLPAYGRAVIYFLLLFGVFATAFVLYPRHRWPTETRANLVGKCTLFNMAMGSSVAQSKAYCECVAAEYERQRPAEWLNAPDSPADAEMEDRTQKKCTEETYAKFPKVSTTEYQERTCDDCI